VNFATLADYHGTSYFALEWTGVAGVGYPGLPRRRISISWRPAASTSRRIARRSDDEQRLELQQLALDPAHVEAFRLVTAAPLPSAGGAMRHRDPLPGDLRNRFVYRVRAVGRRWQSRAVAAGRQRYLRRRRPARRAAAGRPCGRTPRFRIGRGLLRWAPNAGETVRGYRLYRADDAATPKTSVR
jgi:hypothetical protein